MKIISEANDSVLRILARFKTTNGTRLFRYCVTEKTDDGILLFNTLTREMVLLSDDEYANLRELDYLRKRWFLVPEDCNEKEYADLVKWVLKNRKQNAKNTTSYTIFTTTDCNARCFYCFELGRSRVPMSDETAQKVVQYIKSHCGGESVKLRWFGGEPLFNQNAIDTICSGLCREGIVFQSSAVSNGYFFDEVTVQKAVKDWNLKAVQITLDGTEAIYNKVKAYIHREGSAYRKVLDNIGYLLDAGVLVHVRLNMDLHNAEDLLQLVDDLADRFQGKTGLRIYAHPLFQGDEAMAQTHSEDEWRKREEAMCRLNDKIDAYGLAARLGISRKIKLNNCMADSGEGVTILPNGEIGLCGHFSDSEFIGHIDREEIDHAMVASWKETMPEVSECADCFDYPVCVRLKKCCNANICFSFERKEKLRKTRQQMKNTYFHWKNKLKLYDEEDAGC